MAKINKRYIYIALSLFILLFCGTIFFFSVRKHNTHNKDEIIGVGFKNAAAIPVDAIALYGFHNISFVKKDFMDTTSLFSRFVRNDNGLSKLIKVVDAVCRDKASLIQATKSEVLFSVHYSARNDLSLLFCIDLSNPSIDKERFKKSILESYKGYGSRSYNGVEIVDLKNIQFSIYENTFIASTSPLVLESSIRHLLSKTSVMDNKELTELLKNTVDKDNLLFVNNQYFGKIFSGVTDWKFWGYADFFSKFSSWTSLTGEFDSNSQLYTGNLINLKGVGNFSFCFGALEGKEPQVMKILPHTTFGFITLPLKDFKRFLNVLKEYKELYKKLNSQTLVTHQKWFLSLDPEEVSIAAIPYGGEIKWVTVIKSDRNELSEKGKVERYNHKGAMADLFGGFFNKNKEESCCRVGDWMIIGEADIIKSFSDESLLKFTMDEYFDQTDLSGKIVKDNTLLSVFVNVSSQTDSLASLFKPAIRGLVSQRLKQKNLEALSFQVTSVEDQVNMDLLLYASKMEKLPKPRKEIDSKPAGWQLDTVVRVPTGPFELKGFNEGTTEYLEQLPNYKLRLLDKGKKGVWAVPFATPLRGHVAIVDYFRNMKKQMLFASGNQLYLLDRKGRFVNPYPKKVDSLIMLGPKIYDIKGDGDFVIMLLHTDNSLRLYDRDCKYYSSFKAIKTTEIIKDFPELVKVGGKRFWLLRTQLQTLIYNINGNPVTKFEGKNVLSPSTKVRIVSDEEVVVSTTADKDIVLNLETGKIKRYRK